mgnify:CR=1 FL=1
MKRETEVSVVFSCITSHNDQLYMMAILPTLQEDRYKKFSSYKNKKMLWHGTSIAVAAAILKGGLRIMPHSGGRVGKGIYFASEAAKSLGYSKS